MSALSLGHSEKVKNEKFESDDEIEIDLSHRLEAQSLTISHFQRILTRADNNKPKQRFLPSR
jgi:hypothetical protein